MNNDKNYAAVIMMMKQTTIASCFWSCVCLCFSLCCCCKFQFGFIHTIFKHLALENQAHIHDRSNMKTRTEKNHRKNHSIGEKRTVYVKQRNNCFKENKRKQREKKPKLHEEKPLKYLKRKEMEKSVECECKQEETTKRNAGLT